MSKSAWGHHCIFIEPKQAEKLYQLASMTNTLFRRVQEISVTDLLYAVLWRRIAAVGLCCPATTLTVIEESTREAMTGDALGTDIMLHTLSCAADYLAMQPLVVAAQGIRNSLAGKGYEDSYEGWLVDSVGTVESRSVIPASSGALIGSTLAVPDLLRFIFSHLPIHPAGTKRSYGSLEGLYHEAEVPCHQDGNSGRQSEGASDSVQDFGLASTLPIEARTRPLPRIFCINKNVSERPPTHAGGAMAAGSCAVDVQQGVISIDIWLPRAEMDRFQSMYGELCVVGDYFFEN